MGYLSSWAAMAITHHIIIHYCYHINNIAPANRRYCVIGDDVAISHKGTAESYKEVLNSLGMEISLGKSITPYDKNHISAEIAKRYFHNGEEISPLTPKLIIQGTNCISSLLDLDRKLASTSYYK